MLLLILPVMYRWIIMAFTLSGLILIRFPVLQIRPFRNLLRDMSRVKAQALRVFDGRRLQCQVTINSSLPGKIPVYNRCSTQPRESPKPLAFHAEQLGFSWFELGTVSGF